MILIDFNIYNEKDATLSSKKNIIESFIEETLLIFNNYLSSSDRLGIMVYINEYKIVCPLLYVNDIDSQNFYKDLNHYKDNMLNEIEEKENSEIDFNEFDDNDEFNYLENINDSYKSKEDSDEKDDNLVKYYDIIKGLVKTINYIMSYFEIKEGLKKERYIIIFTDIVNLQIAEENKQIEIIFDNLKCDKYLTLFLVGKNKKFNGKKENKNIEELILGKFGEKSEIINFDNMKKIKTLLSNNRVIKEEIFYPNEIYK